MSVVNQMLLELDRRRASANERAALPGMVRALPPDTHRPIPWTLAAGAALLLCAGVAAAWMVQGRTESARVYIADAAQTAAPAAQALAAETEPQLKWADLLASVPQDAAAITSPSPRPLPNPPPRAGEGKGSDNAPAVGMPKHLPRPEAGKGDENLPLPSTIPNPPPQAGEGKGGGDPAPAAAAPAQTGEIVIDKRPAESAQHARPAPHNADAIAATLREARALAQRGEAAAAAELLKRHASAAAANAEYRGLHAAVLQRLTLHAEAVEEYRAALRLAPSASVWWLGLAISLESLGRAREAREAFERARAGNLSAELAAYAEQRIQAQR